jgi:hypothetical protein
MLTENNNQYRKWIDISINITTTYRWSHEGDISQLCYIQSSDWIKINLPYLSSDVFSWDVIYSFQILQFGLSTNFKSSHFELLRLGLDQIVRTWNLVQPS